MQLVQSAKRWADMLDDDEDDEDEDGDGDGDDVDFLPRGVTVTDIPRARKGVPRRRCLSFE